MTTYVPRPGDTVRFYSWAANMELIGEVLSVAPQSRMATVREDNDEGETFMKSWDVLKPVKGAHPLQNLARAHEAEALLREAETRAASWWETAKTFCRTARVSCDLANSLQAQIDAFPYETGAPVGDRVAARIADYRERAEKAEADRDYWKNRAEITHLQHVAANKRADDAEAELAKFDGVLVPKRELDEMTEYAEEVRSRSEENYQRAYKAEADLRNTVKFWTENYCELANAKEKAEADLEDRRKRVQNLKADRNTWRDRVTGAEQRLHDEKARSDLWKARAHRNSVERKEQADRAEKAERELETFKQNQTSNADAAEARIEELEDQLRIQKSRADAFLSRAHEAEDWQHEAMIAKDRLRALRTSVVDAANSAGVENLSYHYSDTDKQIAYVVGQLTREHDELANRANVAEARVRELEAGRENGLQHISEALSNMGMAMEIGENFVKIVNKEIKPDPQPYAVIDGDGDRWEHDPDTGLYECEVSHLDPRTLEEVERHYCINKRMY